MAHVRESITAAAAAAISGLPTTGARVFRSKVVEWQPNELPGWNVAAGDEEIERRSGNLDRTVQLIFQGVVRQPTGLAAEQQLHTMLAELEVALTNLAGVQWLELLGVGDHETETDEADQVLMSITVVYLAHYGTAWGAPESALPN